MGDPFRDQVAECGRWLEELGLAPDTGEPRPQKALAAAGRRVVDVASLARSDWVITTGPVDYVREATMSTCRRAGFSPRVVAEGDEFAVTQGYVAVGLGVALAPVLALGAVREHVVVRRLRTPPEPRHIWLATRSALADQPAVRQMIAALRAAAGTPARP